MKNKLRVGVVGGGNMGAAIIGGIRSKYYVRVCENSASRRRFLKKKFKLSAVSLKKLAETSGVIVLAVKPQDFENILKKLKEFITQKHLVVSIAAGVTTRYIQKQLGKNIRVIRTMPNLPAQVSMGMTAIAGGAKATQNDLRTAKGIFQSVGLTTVVAEKKIDAITAVSGSGPAYVFHFIEAFQAAAAGLGLKKKEAGELVDQTLYGSLSMLMDSSKDAAALCKKVTSKGGTTEAALKVFHKNQFKQTFARALRAAKKRAKELSK